MKNLRRIAIVCFCCTFLGFCIFMFLDLVLSAKEASKPRPERLVVDIARIFYDSPSRTSLDTAQLPQKMEAFASEHGIDVYDAPSPGGQAATAEKFFGVFGPKRDGQHDHISGWAIVLEAERPVVVRLDFEVSLRNLRTGNMRP